LAQTPPDNSSKSNIQENSQAELAGRNNSKESVISITQYLVSKYGEYLSLVKYMDDGVSMTFNANPNGEYNQEAMLEVRDYLTANSVFVEIGKLHPAKLFIPYDKTQTVNIGGYNFTVPSETPKIGSEDEKKDPTKIAQKVKDMLRVVNDDLKGNLKPKPLEQ
jgi:hypothetical protein